MNPALRLAIGVALALFRFALGVLIGAVLGFSFAIVVILAAAYGGR